MICLQTPSFAWLFQDGRQLASLQTSCSTQSYFSDQCMTPNMQMLNFPFTSFPYLTSLLRYLFNIAIKKNFNIMGYIHTHASFQIISLHNLKGIQAFSISHSNNHLHIKPILYLKSEVRNDGKVLHMHCTVRLLRYVVTATNEKARDETKNSLMLDGLVVCMSSDLLYINITQKT